MILFGMVPSFFTADEFQSIPHWFRLLTRVSKVEDASPKSIPEL